MEGTNIYFPDTDRTHDHTYYGNGCPNRQDQTIPDTWGGSEVACSTRLTQTYDGETQKIGTYYDGQAGSSGSGETVAEENANYPDTFCPLGWQLPYAGTGGDYYDKSKTWRFLYNTTYHYVSGAGIGNTISSYPFSEVYSGYMNGDVQRYFAMGSTVLHYSSTKLRTAYYDFSLSTNGLNVSQGAGARDRHSLRCGFMVSILTYVENWLIFKTGWPF